ncbi:hypothetical protein ROTO_23820 [Roseovarius tolerans]|uniref:DoxX-like family protein n=1 Tax=Roseovarius tolerans TaxID=74031 RepID=A0A0L6CTP2_9RHOB|nr:hypothetical protein [Roseovarius tolerans]KNX41081.1 hypothetical protein ROTO_23820 [Roseovarius tolerans]
MISSPISKQRFVIAIYVLCFAIGALSQGKDFIYYGWRSYKAAPLPIEVFWSGLIWIDILVVVVLLSRKRRLGVVLALSVMLADIAINSYATRLLGFAILVGPLVLQSVFLGFILGSICIVLETPKWRKLDKVGETKV